MAQVPPQHRRRCRAVDIVVAEDGDGFTADDRFRQPQRGDAHVGERVRVRHERAHGRVEEARRLVELDGAAGENAPQQLGHIRAALRDRKRARCASFIEAVAPRASASRALHPEKKAPLGDDRRRQGDCHLRHHESHQKACDIG